MPKKKVPTWSVTYGNVTVEAQAKSRAEAKPLLLAKINTILAQNRAPKLMVALPDDARIVPARQP